MPVIHEQQTQIRQAWLNVLVLLLVLYAFFFSIELLSKSIKLFGEGLAEHLFTLTSNPFVALFIGIGATSLMQSSSATTTMVVGMMASGVLCKDGIPCFELAVPIIMGANVGTSVTNTLVSLGHIGHSAEFRRAFAASTVHDMFNLMAVLVFFPLEMLTGFLSSSGVFMVEFIKDVDGLKLLSPLKAIIKPAVSATLQLIDQNPWVGLVLALIVLFLSIGQLTKVLKRLFLGTAETWFQRYLFNNAGKALALGVALTALVQSSSITTSLIVPIAGAGILTLQQIFPYTLGANIGTTVTAIMASLVTQNPAAVSIALVHLLFNICGTVLVWPLRQVPCWMAENLAALSIHNRVIPFAYVLFTFILLPLGVIFLSQ